MVNPRSFSFFRDHAGYVVGERAVCAIALARAEQFALDQGFTYSWGNDECGADCLGDHEYWCNDARRRAAGYDGGRYDRCDHEVLAVILEDANGNVLASLGGIIDPDADYRRVVEAELASEAMHDYVPALVGCP